MIEATQSPDKKTKKSRQKAGKDEIQKTIAELTIEMRKAAELLQFELAAQIRDEIRRLEEE